MPEPPVIVENAVCRYLRAVQNGRQGDSEIDWVWFHCSTQDERDRVEQWLVETEHGLAYIAGTPKLRFRLLVKERAHAQLQERSATHETD